MATLCLDCDESQSGPQQSHYDSQSFSTKESTLIPIESVRHHWAPQFLPNAILSTPVFSKAHRQRPTDSQPPMNTAPFPRSGITSDETLENISSPPQFNLSTFLSSLASTNSVGCGTELGSTGPPSKKRKFCNNTAPTTLPNNQGHGERVSAGFDDISSSEAGPSSYLSHTAAKHKSTGTSTLSYRPMYPIERESPLSSYALVSRPSPYATRSTTTAPTLPKFLFEELSPTCIPTLSAAPSITSQLKTSFEQAKLITPLVAYPSLTDFPAQAWKEAHNKRLILENPDQARTKTLLAEPCSSVVRSSLWRQSSTSKVLRPTFFSTFCSLEKDAFPSNSKLNTKPEDFFEMGHSIQCWCSKHREAASRASNSMKDASLLSPSTIAADSTQPLLQEQELDLETGLSHLPESNAMDTHMEAGTEIGTDPKIYPSSESEDWYDLDDVTCQKTAFEEEDWAFVPHGASYHELQTDSLPDSDSLSEASVSISLPPTPPLTPNVPLTSTPHTALSDDDDGNATNSCMMNAVCFSQDRDCTMCLRCECACNSANASAVEWPSLKESVEMRQRGRSRRIW